MQGFARAVLEMESGNAVQFPGPFAICDMDLFVRYINVQLYQYPDSTPIEQEQFFKLCSLWASFIN